MKAAVPNLCRASGVSHEFRLAYRTLTYYLERVRDGEPARTRYLALRSFLHRPLLRYEEHFSPETHEDVVTPDNAAAVGRINAVIDQLNELRGQQSTDFEKLDALHTELEALISGNTSLS